MEAVVEFISEVPNAIVFVEEEDIFNRLLPLAFDRVLVTCLPRPQLIDFVRDHNKHSGGKTLVHFNPLTHPNEFVEYWSIFDMSRCLFVGGNYWKRAYALLDGIRTVCFEDVDSMLPGTIYAKEYLYDLLLFYIKVTHHRFCWLPNFIKRDFLRKGASDFLIICIEGTVCNGKSCLTRELHQFLTAWFPCACVGSCLEPDEIWEGALRVRQRLCIDDNVSHPINKDIAKIAVTEQFSAVDFFAKSIPRRRILIMERSPVFIYLLWGQVLETDLRRWLMLYSDSNSQMYHYYAKRYFESAAKKRAVCPSIEWHTEMNRALKYAFKKLDFLPRTNNFLGAGECNDTHFKKRVNAVADIASYLQLQKRVPH